MDDYPLTKQGVRDLNSIKPSQPSPKVHIPPPDQKDLDLLDGPMQHDLLYDPAAYQDVRNRFPHARIERTYDYIKGERLVVEIPDCTLRTWLKFIIAEGWGSTSLICQFMMLDNARAIASILDDMSPGWRERARRERRRKK